MVAALLFNLLIVRLSRWRSSHHGSGLSELEPLKASYWRYNVNKRQGCLTKNKNNRLIGK